ncbi:hypothetical protein DIPPA_28196 [Diplonema papillatum]|nr:hypothetical protein DIPPA_28196 [Diplonema papillatum]
MASFLLPFACCAAAQYPVVEFSPPVAHSVVGVAEGMNAWGDLPEARLVDVPAYLLADHKAVVLAQELPAGTTVTVTCPPSPPDGGDTCDVYAFVYHCPPCAEHAGLPAVLLAQGWIAGSCAPGFLLEGGGPRNEMAAFRKQIGAGEAVSFKAARSGRFVALAVSPYGTACGGVRHKWLCNTDSACRWDGGSCVDDWCPRRFQPGGKPRTCGACASAAAAVQPPAPCLPRGSPCTDQDTCCGALQCDHSWQNGGDVCTA